MQYEELEIVLYRGPMTRQDQLDNQVDISIGEMVRYIFIGRGSVAVVGYSDLIDATR